MLYFFPSLNEAITLRGHRSLIDPIAFNCRNLAVTLRGHHPFILNRSFYLIYQALKFLL